MKITYFNDLEEKTLDLNYLKITLKNGDTFEIGHSEKFADKLSIMSIGGQLELNVEAGNHIRISVK